jgi:hypothetical protein
MMLGMILHVHILPLGHAIKSQITPFCERELTIRGRVYRCAIIKTNSSSVKMALQSVFIMLPEVEILLVEEYHWKNKRMVTPIIRTDSNLDPRPFNFKYASFARMNQLACIGMTFAEQDRLDEPLFLDQLGVLAYDALKDTEQNRDIARDLTQSKREIMSKIVRTFRTMRTIRHTDMRKIELYIDKMLSRREKTRSE